MEAGIKPSRRRRMEERDGKAGSRRRRMEKVRRRMEEARRRLEEEAGGNEVGDRGGWTKRRTEEVEKGGRREEQHEKHKNGIYIPDEVHATTYVFLFMLLVRVRSWCCIRASCMPVVH